MSTARAPRDPARSRERERELRSPRDPAELRSRRLASRRRRRLARVDLGLGFLGALIVLLATPGLAIATLIALIVIALVVASVVVERRRSRAAPSTRRRWRIRSPAGGRSTGR